MHQSHCYPLSNNVRAALFPIFHSASVVGCSLLPEHKPAGEWGMSPPIKHDTLQHRYLTLDTLGPGLMAGQPARDWLPPLSHDCTHVSSVRSGHFNRLFLLKSNAIDTSALYRCGRFMLKTIALWTFLCSLFVRGQILLCRSRPGIFFYS